MKRLMLVAVFLFGFAAIAAAEGTPAVEIFGGYSFFHFTNTGPDSNASSNMNGWDASIAFNANKWAGFVADVGGIYTTDFGAKFKVHSLMFGPKIAARKGKVTPFVQALFGVAMARVHSSQTGEEFLGENDFVMALGGGVDIHVAPAIAIRPVQAEYIGVKPSETGANFANCFRYSAGIVFRLGKR